MDHNRVKVINRLWNNAVDRARVDDAADREHEAGFPMLAKITARQGFVVGGKVIGSGDIFDCLFTYHSSQCRADIRTALKCASDITKEKFTALLSECVEELKKDIFKIYILDNVDDVNKTD